MLALIWKELRERVPWAVALMVISIHAACARGYTFYGSPGTEMLNWSIGPVLIAFLMGASGYASELTARRSVFLMTRPITWQALLASKLISNAAVIVAAAVVAALAHKAFCPAAYASVATTSRLLLGIGNALALTGIAFLIGFACSSVIAGVAEAAAVAAIQGIALLYIFSLGWTRFYGLWWQVMIVLWPVPLLCAGLVVARFGLTLSAPQRIRRYSSAASLGMVILGIIAFAIPESFVNSIVRARTSGENITWSISPDGLYALGRDTKRLYWLDIAHNRMTRLETIYADYSAGRVTLEDICWLSPHTAYRIAYQPRIWLIRTYQGASHRDIPMEPLGPVVGYPSAIHPTPDGRIAAVSISTGMDLPLKMIFVDVAAARKFPQSVVRPAGSRTWWRAGSVFCFTDASGTPRSLALSSKTLAPAKKT